MKKEREGRGERDWREEGERGNGRKKNVGKEEWKDKRED